MEKTSFANYPDSIAISNYKRIAIDMLRRNFPSLTEHELSASIDWSISKHLQDTPVTIDNNYKNQQVQTTLLQVVEYVVSREPIMTSYGVLFNRHGVVPNPLYGVIDGFINSRKAYKKEMFKYPKGSELFEKFNLLQLLAKIDAKQYPLASLNPLNCWKLLRAL